MSPGQSNPARAFSRAHLGGMRFIAPEVEVKRNGHERERYDHAR